MFIVDEILAIADNNSDDLLEDESGQQPAVSTDKRYADHSPNRSETLWDLELEKETEEAAKGLIFFA